MLWLVLAAAASVNVADCTKELGGSKEAKEACEVPGISLAEARELYHLHVACEALKKAVEASHRKYQWVEIRGNDGFTARCEIQGN